MSGNLTTVDSETETINVERMRRAMRVLDGPPLPTRSPKYGYEPGVDLYIMQNETGRIKIGRSGNCEVRRATLEMACGVKIVLLAILPGRGEDERRLHAALHNYRQMGEWFSRDVAPALQDAAEIEFDLIY